MNYEGVYRTAPASPGLSKIVPYGESQGCSHCPEGQSPEGQCEHPRDLLREQGFDTFLRILQSSGQQKLLQLAVT